jgi:hypothetical protein
MVLESAIFNFFARAFFAVPAGENQQRFGFGAGQSDATGTL